MKPSEYTFAKHVGAGLLAGLLFSLAVGLIFSLKMIGINESTHQFHYAYPFVLNFIPMYLLLGIIFGLVAGAIGGMLLRNSQSPKGLGLLISFGISLTVFLVAYLIFRVPLGPIVGMFLALLIFITAYGKRPSLSRLYFAVFFTAVLFNYSWQWVRQHFIINPLLPLNNSKTIDVVFTIIWAIIFILGFRIFQKAFFKLPVKAFYVTGGALVALLLVLGGGYYLLGPSPVVAEMTGDLQINHQPTDVKVALIGIDGMWWRVIDPLLEQDRLPNLKTLMENGSYGQLATICPTFSAAIWTSISTGKLPDKHGVTSFLVWKFPWSGFTLPCHITPKITAEIDWMKHELIIVAPMTNQFLDATPIWDMLTDGGSTVGTVNWWVSWPASRVNGFVVTDHCLYNKEYITENFKRKEGDTPYDIYPQELLDELIGFSRSPDDLSEEEVRRFINITDPSFLDEFYAIDTYDYLDIAYMASMFKYSYPEDATFAGATRYLIETRQPDLLCVYMDGVDSMEHQYLRYHFWEQHPDKLLPQNIERYRDLINNYYIYMDEVVGSFMEVADPNTIFIIISDHGFDEFMLPTGHYNHMNAPPGVFICSGPGIKQNNPIEGAHICDITPTILHALGYPVAEDFDGKVLTDIFVEQNPVNTIPTYETGRRGSHQLMQSDIDEAYKDKLRALGYTQ